MKTMIKKAYYFLFIVILSIKWIFRTTLCDSVKYKGKIYSINNGVICGKWTLLDENLHPFDAPRNECKKVWSIKGIKNNFVFGYSFYISNWFDIWVREGIKPWMRECNIW